MEQWIPSAIASIDSADITSIASAATAIVAIVALLFAWRQLSENRRNQKEATATNFYKDYLLLAIQYPELAYPNYEKISASKDTAEYQKYTWLVAYMLTTCELIMELFPEDPGWTATVEEQLLYHKDYFIKDFNAKELDDYCQFLVAVIEKLQLVRRDASKQA